MSHLLGPLPVAHSQADSAKFTAPLVLLHGLWDSPQSWRRFSGFLSHRGWRCIALGLHRSGTRNESVEELRSDVAAAMDALDERPVLIGHDLGATIATDLRARCRAVIAMAPLTLNPPAPAVVEALRAAGTLWQRFQGGMLRAPSGRWSAAYPPSRRRESAQLIRDLAGGAPGHDDSSSIPQLVVAGTDDVIVSDNDASLFASRSGGELRRVAAGHGLHWETGWEERVGMVHKWLVQTLGVDLLVLYDEAWADREDS